MPDGQTNMTHETDAPIADGLDDWWRTAASVDAAEREKAAVAAGDFQAHRTARYLESGGADQVGGWMGSPLASGRTIYQLRGRRIDWR
jgi:hypothetical protein